MSKGARAATSGVPNSRAGVPPRTCPVAWNDLLLLGSAEAVGVVPHGHIVKGIVIEGALIDAIEGSIHEAPGPSCELVDKGHHPRPSGSAGTRPTHRGDVRFPFQRQDDEDPRGVVGIVGDIVEATVAPDARPSEQQAYRNICCQIALKTIYVPNTK